MSDYLLAQVMQAVERMIMVATVVQRVGDKAKVEWAGGAVSDWLSIAQLGSEDLKFWIPPEAGTQVLVISPGGNTAHGIIYPGPFQGDIPDGNFSGQIVGVGDVIASDISLVTHKHGGIDRGISKTDEPE